MKSLVNNNLNHNYQKKLNINFKNIKRSFVFKNNTDLNILGSSNTLNEIINKNNELEKFKNIKLHENSRIFINNEIDIDPKYLKELIKSICNYSFKDNTDKILLEINLTIIPVEKKNKSVINTGWYKFIDNENTLMLSGTLFFFYNNFSELLNYFSQNKKMELILSKTSKQKNLWSTYPFNMYAKTYFEDKNIFFIE